MQDETTGVGSALSGVGVRIGLLGPIEVRVHRTPRDIGGPRARMLLATLALGVGRTIPVDRLVATVWLDPPPSARGSLSALVSRLRRVVAPATIRRRGEAYVLDLPREDVDVVRFDRDADEALGCMRDGAPELALQRIDRALGMWRGRPLEGLEDRRAVVLARRRLRDRHTDLSVARGQALVDLGRLPEAISHLQHLTARVPHREHGWVLLASALYWTGRQQEALMTVRNAVAVQREAAGLDPGPALARLEHDILTHAPRLRRQPRAQG